MPENMTDEQARQWAITQAIYHHKGTGITMDKIIAEAEALIAYIKNGKAE